MEGEKGWWEEKISQSNYALIGGLKNAKFKAKPTSWGSWVQHSVYTQASPVWCIFFSEWVDEEFEVEFFSLYFLRTWRSRSAFSRTASIATSRLARMSPQWCALASVAWLPSVDKKIKFKKILYLLRIKKKTYFFEKFLVWMRFPPLAAP